MLRGGSFNNNPDNCRAWMVNEVSAGALRPTPGLCHKADESDQPHASLPSLSGDLIHRSAQGGWGLGRSHENRLATDLLHHGHKAYGVGFEVRADGEARGGSGGSCTTLSTRGRVDCQTEDYDNEGP